MKTKSKAKSGKTAAVRVKTAAQEALEVTWVLKGHLKNAQISYIRVCILLAKVRDQKLYEALHHADMEDYAAQRLNLGRSSLYKYLQVHDWMREFHPEWLASKPKGFIPDLSDAADLIWIERELARKDLGVEKRAGLDALRKKALAGELRQGEVERYRRQGQGRKPADESIKSFLSKLRALRKRASATVSIPPEVVSHLDAAIETLKNVQPLLVAGLYPSGGGGGELYRRIYLA